MKNDAADDQEQEECIHAVYIGKAPQVLKLVTMNRLLLGRHRRRR